MCFLNSKACQHILLHKIIIFKKASYDPFKSSNRVKEICNYIKKKQEKKQKTVYILWSLLFQLHLSKRHFINTKYDNHFH